MQSILFIHHRTIHHANKFVTCDVVLQRLILLLLVIALVESNIANTAVLFFIIQGVNNGFISFS